jgi:adenosylcobinamide kinase/adenosylcobinamide-phosphate guanylyltransferase
MHPTSLTPRHELVTGGTRSGKSRFAERRALAHPGPVVYVATTQRYADDAEFEQRIQRHRERRPPHWALVETGPDLAATLREHAKAGSLVLVDCLGMWLMQFCGEEGFKDAWPAARAALLEALAEVKGEVVLVSNEIGWGVVGMSALTRRYVDELGWLNQAVAERCARVTLVACGLPLTLKDTHA